MEKVANIMSCPTGTGSLRTLCVHEIIAVVLRLQLEFDSLGIF